ncbi:MULTISPECIES: C40 family peptidase [Paraburkholderia]|uniref:C40 family peptidase n=1 Tax=Paraburkholderia TaxID=1822464 RepID=UPI0022561B8A|nr:MULTISPECIES: NlpC/P60 family protein [Paraburkholderia]MCX4165131.1 NlpC/P60 family protein [Paraburkholderia megapolitana]MDN7160624.1 NlpC/P60 family protein [Paraburkholderia sp. CHISQ3]MDQ6497671.1 NlpC/P60 family protein [Paraburkholderia megapolitana]
MRRLGFSLLIVVLLAACSSAPQRISRSPSSAPVAGNAYRTTPPGFPNFVDHSVGREEISIQAMSLVGIPYRWGGNTPEAGFDCSGLVRYVVDRAASVNLPRTTADMSGRGETIEPDEVAPGDLIFFNTTGRPHSHVGIYVGKLRFVNAPSTGGTVRIDYLTNPYWAKRFDGIRRVAPAKTAPFDTPVYQASTVPERVAPAAPATVAAAVPQAVPLAAAPTMRAVSSQPPLTASVAPTAATASASADPFEPPPPGMSAAQMQARAAGAVTPPTASAPPVEPASMPNSNAVAATETIPAASTAVQTNPAIATTRQSADPIDAAADAFEPPPPSSIAVRQAQQARRAGTAESVQIMRASTASRPIPAPTQTGDDPIARFANGSD